ncbi:hypothetical protein D5086_031146 [Populus alba]|uniref:Uncharacterized protein n=1 Tax=Populus alba TaxID=43335 RepID=A0ACC4AQI1_POPAL
MVALRFILVRAAVLLAICDQLPVVGGAGCTAVAINIKVDIDFQSPCNRRRKLAREKKRKKTEKSTLLLKLNRAAVLLAICDQLPVVGGAGCTAVVGESS